MNGTVSIFNSTVAYNATRLGSNIVAENPAQMAQGGAVYSLTLGKNAPTAALHLGNSILSNTLSAGSTWDLVTDNQQGKTTTTIDSSGPNLVTSCSFCDNPTQVTSLQFIVKQDPMLERLADNGGAAQTLAPGASSQAVGRGEPALCTGPLVHSLDQRGVARPPSCTLGAYESTPPEVASGGCQLSATRSCRPVASPALAAVLGLALGTLLRRRRRAAR